MVYLVSKQLTRETIYWKMENDQKCDNFDGWSGMRWKSHVPFFGNEDINVQILCDKQILNENPGHIFIYKPAEPSKRLTQRAGLEK